MSSTKRSIRGLSMGVSLKVRVLGHHRMPHTGLRNQTQLGRLELYQGCSFLDRLLQVSHAFIRPMRFSCVG